MDALHGGDDAQAAEARDVFGGDVLRVLDAPAQVIAGDARLGPDALIEIEHLAVGAVADGVGVHLKAMLQGDAGGFLDHPQWLEHQAGTVRQVGIGGEQPSAVGAEGTVDLPLDGAHGQEVVALDGHPIVRQPLGQDGVVLAAHHDVQAHLQGALVLQAAQQVDVGEGGAGILKGSDPEAQRPLAGQLDPLPLHGFGCLGA